MKKLTKIQWINIIIYSFFALLLFIPWKMIFLQHHKKTCGFVYAISKTKGIKYVDFSYQTEDKKWMTSSESMDNFSVKRLDSLKKMGCIKIIYSSNFNSWTKITDKRLLME